MKKTMLGYTIGSKKWTSNQSVIKTEYISFDAVFDALSEYRTKKMEDNFLDPSLTEIPSADSIILVIDLQYIYFLRLQWTFKNMPHIQFDRENNSLSFEISQ